MISEDNHHNDNDDKQAKETEELQALIRTVERDTSNYLIGVLQAIIREQTKARNLTRATGAYIYDSVKDSAVKRGWLE